LPINNENNQGACVIALYWVWRLGTIIVGIVPRRVSYAIAGWIGTAVFYLMPLRRRIAQENFAHVLNTHPDDRAVKQVARTALQNYVRLLRDTMLYPSLSYQEIEARVTLHNPEHFRDALALGKGVILVSAHFGNMDLAGAVMATRYTPVTLISETLQPPQLMNWLVRAREKHNVLPYPYDRAPRKMIEAVKKNEMVAMLLDFGVTHHFDLTTVPVKFFGADTNFPAGPAQLALLTGAAIIVGHAHMRSDGHIDVFTNPPLIVEKTGKRQHDLQVTMQKIACLMEDFIRRDPGQWYMFRPMWKDMPSASRKIPSLSKASPSRVNRN
jgi:KDO2-lipid IV(A) lauroyltransferase